MCGANLSTCDIPTLHGAGPKRVVKKRTRKSTGQVRKYISTSTNIIDEIPNVLPKRSRICINKSGLHPP